MPLILNLNDLVIKCKSQLKAWFTGERLVWSYFCHKYKEESRWLYYNVLFLPLTEISASYICSPPTQYFESQNYWFTGIDTINSYQFLVKLRQMQVNMCQNDLIINYISYTCFVSISIVSSFSQPERMVPAWKYACSPEFMQSTYLTRHDMCRICTS